MTAASLGKSRGRQREKTMNQFYVRARLSTMPSERFAYGRTPSPFDRAACRRRWRHLRQPTWKGAWRLAAGARTIPRSGREVGGKISDQAQPRFLQQLWLNPPRGYNAAVQAGLKAADFSLSFGFVFAYCGVCAELSLSPSLDECLQLARRADSCCTLSDLDHILFFTHSRCDRVEQYAMDAATDADARRTDDCRFLAREALRALARGLEMTDDKYAPTAVPTDGRTEGQTNSIDHRMGGGKAHHKRTFDARFP